MVSASVAVEGVSWQVSPKGKRGAVTVLDLALLMFMSTDLILKHPCLHSLCPGLRGFPSVLSCRQNTLRFWALVTCDWPFLKAPLKRHRLPTLPSSVSAPLCHITLSLSGRPSFLRSFFSLKVKLYQELIHRPLNSLFERVQVSSLQCVHVVLPSSLLSTPEYFHHKETKHHWKSSHSPFLYAPGSHSPRSESVDLSGLDISHNWNSSARGLSCLASFT